MGPAPSPFRGLVAATHTPFDADGRLALDVAESQARALREGGVTAAFVGGSTGEFPSLTFDERAALAERWLAVGRDAGLRVIVHVGGTQVEAGAELARRAQAGGADAIAALAPFYFRPRDADELTACCAKLASGAPETGFYYYDIPGLTGVDVPVGELLDRARSAIPNLVGVKYTNPDLVPLQECLAREGLDVLYGNDESILAALALGVRGVVGSTYNLAPGPYLRLARAFRDGDLEAARREQLRSVTLVRTLAARGYMASARAAMETIGVPVGPPRLPARPLDDDARRALHGELERIGFFEWRAAPELAAEGGAAW